MLLATSKSSAAAAAAPQPQELPTTLMLSVGEEDTALRKEARCLGVAKKLVYITRSPLALTPIYGRLAFTRCGNACYVLRYIRFRYARRAPTPLAVGAPHAQRSLHTEHSVSVGVLQDAGLERSVLER